MATSGPIAPQGIGSGASLPLDDGVIFSPLSSTALMIVPFTGLSSNPLAAYSPGARESDAYDESDEDDADMSYGGAQVETSSSYAEQLNAEMDMIDAEVMGPYNLAAIAANSTLNSSFNSQGNALNGFLGYPAEGDTDDSDYEMQEDEDEDEELFHQGAQLSDPMSEVSQQLQNIQDGQEEQVGFATSVPLHGTFMNMDEQRNLNLQGFLRTWGDCVTRRGNPKKRKRGPNLTYLAKMSRERPTEIRHEDLHGERCDLQGIDWTQLEVSRREARQMRSHTYRSYANLPAPVWHNLTLQRSIIPDHENYFKFRRMDFKPKIYLSHFQLRNLLVCTSRNNICYAGVSLVHCINPLFNQKAIRMDLTDPMVQASNSAPFVGIQISTIGAGHNVLVAGGFGGEYGMTRLDSPIGTAHIEGIITTNINPITNHVQIHLNRHSGQPQAAFASNDKSLRILDCTSNRLVAHHKYEYAINCSAISPDHRLRVIVGDDQNVTICDAERGDVLQDLTGHIDFGFACAWADNGWHVATANQDKLIKIWDARMWTDQHGIGKPLRTISSTVAGVRSLKFSPLGGGKRVLAAAEAADVVNIIDAETYSTRQTLDFFGEICGIDFTPDGQALFVGIYDELRGGIMEFEKCGFGQPYGPKRLHDRDSVAKDGLKTTELDEQSTGLDWRRTNDEVVRDPRSKRTVTHRQRKAARSWDMDPF